MNKTENKTNRVVKYIGKKQKRNTKFEELCKMRQFKVKEYCERELKKQDYNVYKGEGYLLGVPTTSKGATFKTMLVAHMDTVHEVQPKKFIYTSTGVTSSQGIGGDDRCGVYAILEIIRTHKPIVLFTEDEEIGCVGANKFLETEYAEIIKGNLLYIIELDRRGTDDAVFYDCGNEDFVKFVTEDEYFKKAYGSCSDISYLAPTLDCAAVNFSVGYFSEHTLKEWVDLETLAWTIERVKLILDKPVEDKFDWIEAPRKYSYKYKSFYWDDYNWYDDYYENDGEHKTEDINGVEFAYIDTNGKEETDIIIGSTEDICLLRFLKNNGDVPFNNILDYIPY